MSNTQWRTLVFVVLLGALEASLSPEGTAWAKRVVQDPTHISLKGLGGLPAHAAGFAVAGLILIAITDFAPAIVNGLLVLLFLLVAVSHPTAIISIINGASRAINPPGGN